MGVTHNGLSPGTRRQLPPTLREAGPDGAPGRPSHFRVAPTSIPRRCRSGCLPCGSAGLIVPGGRFVPDGTVCPEDWFRGKDPWADPAGLLMVFEVTSTDPHRNRGPKRRGYAAAGIPCYLLVDRGEHEVVLYSDPEDGDCTVHTQVAFGKPLDLPAPFSFTLDTGPLR
ncbi:Uma2 family endonuclease [Kitasatospora purpeofusca]|uniref:Uma2 family endonuclease n=1 Tax=Kitasatospora purpeofusca TaxID=67352 RepID=UPI003655501B